MHPIDENANKGGKFIHEAFLRSQNLALPNFKSDDFLSWFDLLEKRFEDFDIKDPYQKYQLTVGLFSPEEQIKLAPYFSKGSQENHYDNLMEGVRKLFGLDELEIAAKAENMQYDCTELPSSFAHRVRLLLVSGKVPYHEQHIRNMIINKLPVNLVDQLAHYKELDLDNLMQLADSFYTINRSVRNKQKFKDTVGLEDKTVLHQILDTLKSLKTQISRLADANLQNACSSVVLKDVSLTSKTINKELLSPRQGNINNNYEIVENSGICRNHQLYAKRCHNCIPVCKWNKIICCPRHNRFGIKAHFCESPDLCQFSATLKPYSE